ncbi:hypothetical protein [Pseudorhodoferax sp. Leaf274]|uniref:hypothetical protein n=1 Tax=Pseudorhodoferax sp. Leaf274 TaxID=1736318 RepID=UPI000702F877|nr:hypothetical protein [Pseudorhodoferax sp. Leaf274]KQP35377.1 hypothetical protein ASF44_18685 [Pseudorhodoferax sp. Leaf274]
MPELSLELLVDLVLAVGALELLVLLVLRRTALWFTLLAGLALMVALRLTVAAISPAYICLALAASGLLHVIDLQRRWSASAGRRALLSVSLPTKENHE